MLYQSRIYLPAWQSSCISECVTSEWPGLRVRLALHFTQRLSIKAHPSTSLRATADSSLAEHACSASAIKFPLMSNYRKSSTTFYLLLFLSSQRQIVVSPLGEGSVLGLKNLKGVDDPGTGLIGLDDVVDVASLGRLQRVGERFLVLGCLFLAVLASEDDLDRSFCAHDGDLGRRPRVIEIALQMLG